MMNGPVIIQISAVAINRLLKIADHAEMTGPWRCSFGLQPKASRIRWTSYFGENRKLGGICVLCFVQNDVEVFLAQSTGSGGMLQQFVCKGDLIWVCDQAAFDPEIAEITLHFGGNTECGVRHPCPQRRKVLIPTLQKISRATGANRPTNEF